MQQGRYVPRFLKYPILILIVSLAFMKPAMQLLGFVVTATDMVFVLLAATVAVTVIRGRRLRWHTGYWPIIGYLGALALSIFVSPTPLDSAVKMATIVYLAVLAVLTDQLIEDEHDLRACLRAWTIGSGIVILVGAIALIAFAADPESTLARALRFHYGTLPPGHYPRFSLTFLNANMLCNYLTVSIGVLLAARAAGWLDRRWTGTLLAGVLVASLFTISPGLGGILLLLGLWTWALWRTDRPVPALLGLAGGSIAAMLFVVAMAVTPILHPTAPFLIHVSGWTLAPAGRLMVWIDAARNLAAHPLLGHGIGVDAVHVRYQDPSGYLQRLTDAHNTFLNIGAQAGIVGIAALLALLAGVAWRTRPLALRGPTIATVRTALGLTFLVAFAYEGLGGSFEDARHLWVLLGLVLAADRLARTAPTR